MLNLRIVKDRDDGFVNKGYIIQKNYYINQEVTKMNEYARLVMVFFILTYKEIYSWLLCI